MSIEVIRKINGGEVDLYDVQALHHQNISTQQLMLHVVCPGSKPNFGYGLHPVTVTEYKKFLVAVHPELLDGYTQDNQYVSVTRSMAEEYLKWLIVQVSEPDHIRESLRHPLINLDFPSPEQNSYVKELINTMSRERELLHSCYHKWLKDFVLQCDPCWHSSRGSDAAGILPSMPTPTHTIKLENNPTRQIRIVMKYPSFNRAPGWR